MEAGAATLVDLALCRPQSRCLLSLDGQTSSNPCCWCVDGCDGKSPAPDAQAATGSERVTRIPRLVLFRVHDSSGVEPPTWSRLPRCCTRILCPMLDRASMLDYQRFHQITCNVCGEGNGRSGTVCRRTAGEVNSVCRRIFETYSPSTSSPDNACKHSVFGCALAYRRPAGLASRRELVCSSGLHCVPLQVAGAAVLT